MSRYSCANGLRYVKPYYHRYVANAKGHWCGRTCYDVYCNEFSNLPPQHYYNEIMTNHMKLVKNPNSRIHSTTFQGKDLLDKVKIGQGDKIIHLEHVHEPPILDTIPTTVYEDENCYVVDKPSGMPVHPVGTYFYNTLLQLIYSLRPDLEPLYPVHRLDKLTSGILIFGKNSTTTSKFKQLMKAKSVEKTYLARVSGDFIPDNVICEDPVVYIYGSRKEVHQFAPAKTIFKKLFYDQTSDQSVLRCNPISGFSHQIRIHLRNLGYPIVQDTLYRTKYSKIFTDRCQVTKDYLDKIYEESMRIRRGCERDNGNRCPECLSVLYTDPKPSSLSIKLHSLRYIIHGNQGENWLFETQKPTWSLQKQATE